MPDGESYICSECKAKVTGTHQRVDSKGDWVTCGG